MLILFRWILRNPSPNRMLNRNSLFLHYKSVYQLILSLMEQMSYAENKLIENAKLNYILYLVSLAFGITAIIAVIIAYINKDDQMPEWLKSHYNFQINTFWKGMIMLIVGVLTAIIIVGIPILIFWTVWVIIRCIKGMKLLDAQQAHPNPEGWWFD